MMHSADAHGNGAFIVPGGLACDAMTPNPYNEDPLVEQPAMALLSDLGVLMPWPPA